MLNKNMLLALPIVLVLIGTAYALNSGIISKESNIITSAILENNADTSGEAKAGNVQVNVSLGLQQFEIPLTDSDITLDTGNVILETPQSKIVLMLDDTMHLKDFTGTMKWADDTFSLEGKLYEYVTDYVQINWKKEEALVLKVNSGSAKIQDISIGRLESVASGNVKSTTLSVDLDKDDFVLEDYKGSFSVEILPDESTVKLEGRASSIKVKSPDFTAVIS